MVHMGGESWRAIKDLKAPFPDLKAGHVDHLLTCVYFCNFSNPATSDEVLKRTEAEVKIAVLTASCNIP